MNDTRIPFIIHIEDNDAWRNDVWRMLKRRFKFKYMYNSADTLERARFILRDLGQLGSVVKVLILDISLVFENANERGGFRWLAESQLMGFNANNLAVIILSGYLEGHQAEIAVLEEEGIVVGTFDKSEFVDRAEEFLDLVEKHMESD